LAQAGPKSKTFDKALESLNHRGIRKKVISHSYGTVGHVRLPIVGLSTANDQPVQKGNWTIAFVGEILDFRDKDPKAECDLPIVVDRWMTGLTDHDGFWSIVALKNNGTLHVVCDYLAQKPTYYRADVRAAASELNALTILAPTQPDEVYLAAVIKWGYCPEVERTPYRQIKHVLPGEHVRITPFGSVHREIIDPLHPVKGDLKAEIEAAVRRRVLAADVPVACLLSGGLDSSIVYTLARRHGTVIPYYADLGDGDAMEHFRVSAVAGKQKVNEVHGSVDVDDDTCLSYLQEPIDLGSLRPQIALARAIGDKQTVCLTGDGADEGFGGYGRAMRYDSQGSDLFHELPAWHLVRLDRVMMRHRIEVRSPFLARQVVQIALGLPYEERRNKKILRDLFRDDLPPEIADQPKKPLRIEEDREERSQNLVRLFRQKDATWHSLLQSGSPVALVVS
jgi:asparagine synthase (glutamine-hydrolysing)